MEKNQILIILVNKTYEDENQHLHILNIVNEIKFHIKIIPFNLEIKYIRQKK